MNRTNAIKGYVYAILSAIIFGCMPLMAKHIYADGVNAISLVFLRNLLALPGLAVLALMQQKTLKTSVKVFFMTGIPSFFGMTMTAILLFSSYNYLASGTATVFHFIYPSLVVLVGVVFLKKKMAPSMLASMGMCIAGIVMFYNPQERLHPVGVALALVSGLTYAVYIVMLPRFQNEKNHGFYFNFYVTLWSVIVMLPICLGTNQLTLPGTVKGWGLCALFSLSVSIGAVMFFQEGAYIIGGEKTAIVSTLEPITGVVVGILALQEKCRPVTIFGSLLVVGASVLIAVHDLKEKS